MTEHLWFLHYPEGVPHELSIRPETLSAMFSRSAQRFGRRPALYFFGKTLSYHECDGLIERFACGLAGLGVHKGDRVALCLPNSPQAVIAYFGILRAGGIVVACNPNTNSPTSFGTRGPGRLSCSISCIRKLSISPWS
jgi:long-chain acyl-CoA synthetase